MPLDVLGRTRATLTKSASMSYADRCGESCETLSCWGLIFEILNHERGIPSKRKSAACVDYVPALCTHRPSLLPIEWSGEDLLECCGRSASPMNSAEVAEVDPKP